MATALTNQLFSRLRRVRHLTQQGFTLLELLVAVLIGGIITSALLFLVIEMLRVNNREESLTQTQQNMRRAVDFMTRDLGEAVFVYSNFTGGGATYDLLAQLDDEPTGTPVLAFWRLDPLSDDDVNDLNTFCPTQTGDVQEECEALLVRQATYTLVAYFHETNAANDIWEGASRIIRYQLPAYSVISTTALTRNQGYADPTLPVPGITPATFNSFDNWQKAADGANTNGSSSVLTDYVNVVDTAATTACPTLPTAANASYVRTPADDDSFYTCVTQPNNQVANSQDVNKSVILYLQGNASRRDPNRVIGVSESSSLPKLESQVLIRGVIQNRPL